MWAGVKCSLSSIRYVFFASAFPSAPRNSVLCRWLFADFITYYCPITSRFLWHCVERSAYQLKLPSLDDVKCVNLYFVLERYLDYWRASSQRARNPCLYRFSFTFGTRVLQFCILYLLHLAIVSEQRWTVTHAGQAANFDYNGCMVCHNSETSQLRPTVVTKL